MSTPLDTATLDRQVRTYIYDRLITGGKMPMSADIAPALGLSLQDLRESFHRMKRDHILVLQEQAEEILMANPFSAVPTPFVVETANHSWWGNCIWDAMGIVAMVKQDARITTTCGDCNDSMVLIIKNNSIHLQHGDGIVHFAVPARKWWNNIKFT